MKIPLLYGSLLALVGALLTFGLYFAGYHETADKMQSAQWIGVGLGVTATVVCLALAMRDTRARAPLDREWGYGPALGAGVLTGLWASLGGAILAYIYFQYVNPNFSEVAYQMQVAKMEEKGLSAAQIEGTSGMMRKFITPAALSVWQGVGGFIWSVILALIVAIFFRKRAEVAAPETMPPPIA